MTADRTLRRQNQKQALDKFTVRNPIYDQYNNNNNARKNVNSYFFFSHHFHGNRILIDTRSLLNRG